MTTGIDRRTFLSGAAVVGAAGALGALLPPGLARAASISAPAGATLDDIEHVVILMQENRPFDQYFGTMSGVIGFDDPHAVPGVFKQTDSNLATNPSGYVLPWHFDTATTSAQSHGEMLHDWTPQHVMFNNGKMDQFLLGQLNNTSVMGYYRRSDIPYHFALADAFTICDRYHCSVLGPTDPNRIMLMSGTIDAEGTRGGPIIENTPSNGPLKWESFPETMQKAGIDWYVYQENDNYGDNMLPFFAGFADTTTDLYRRGNSFIPTPAGGLLGVATAARIKSDVLAGKLPSVSYIVGAQETTEHPDAGPGRGAQFIDQILMALTSDMKVWAKTLFILNYDENDGAFDHVVPPTPPPGTTGEFIRNLPADAAGAPGPVGLGYRVPMILISPFTRGPLVSSDVFDHISVIKFLERRFGVRCPNVSDWRRQTVGDLTSAINFAAAPSTAVPALPDGNRLAAEGAAQASLPAPVMPTVQVMPTQETLPLRGRPSGLVAAGAGAGTVGSVTGATTKPSVGAGPAGAAVPTDATTTLADTGLSGSLPAVATALSVVGALAVRLRERGSSNVNSTPDA